MKLRLEIECENDALRNDDGSIDLNELSYMLTEFQNRVTDGETDGKLRDVNGNTVGAWNLS